MPKRVNSEISRSGKSQELMEQQEATSNRCIATSNKKLLVTWNNLNNGIN